MPATRLCSLALLLAVACASPSVPSQPSGSVRLETDGQLVTEAILDFGELFPGDRSEREIWVVNDGDTTVSLFVAFSGAPFLLEAAQRSTLAPGERTRWTIAFTPEALGPFTGELLITVTGGDVERLHLELVGASVPRPSGDPACLDIVEPTFTDAVLDCSPALGVVRLVNVCDTPLQLDDARLAAGSADFFVRSRPTFPHRFASGEAIEILFEFSPSEAGSYSGTLELVTGDGIRTVPLAATAVEPTTEVLDVFPPMPKRQVDLLFVLDDSPSFASQRAHQEKQLRRAATFLKSLYGVDIRVAVTTTSVCRDPERCEPDEEGIANGRFLPLDGSAPRVLSPEMPDFQEQLVARAAFIGGGSEQEHLIRPALLALSEPLVSGHNAGFLRDSTHLTVVVVSDAADHDETPVSALLDALYRIKGVRRPDLISFNAVVHVPEFRPNDCASEGDSAVDSQRVLELVRATGGIWESVCAEWWSIFEARNGCADCFWGKDRLPLSRIPWSPASTLRVTADGEPLEPVDAFGAMQWQYGARLNSVFLQPLVAEPFVEHTVRYITCPATSD